MEIVSINRSYSEVYEILNILGEQFIARIPPKMYLFIDEQRDKDYIPNLLKEDGILDEQKISKKALAIFAVLNTKYFIDDEDEKNKLLNIYKKNEMEYQKKIREKYNSDNIFKDNSKTKIDSNVEKLQIIEYKESFFSRIVNKIKSIFFK